MIKKLQIVFLLILFAFVFKEKIFAECIGTFPFDWEIKRIPVNSNLSLSIPLIDIPSGTTITTSIIKKQQDTARANKFGTSGVQVFKDLQPGNLNTLKAAYQQSSPDITGASMVEKHFAMLASQGIRWINLTYSWNSMETSKGNFKTSASDIVFRIAKKYGLNIIPNIHNAPTWAAGLTSCTDSPCKCIPNDISGQNGSQNYNDFLTMLVNRYKPHGGYYQDNPNETDNGYGILNWVVWNEPDNTNPYFFAECNQSGTPQNPAQIQKYSDLFKGAYSTIKNADSNSKVIVAAFLNDANIMSFYQGLTNNGGHKPDILNFHNYASSEPAMRSAIIGFLYKKNNLLGETSKEVWVTEFSRVYDSSTGGDLQKIYLNEVFNLFDSLSGSKVAKALWWPSKGYCTKDCTQGTDTSMALIEPNFFPRKSYYQLGITLGTSTELPKVQTTSSTNLVNINIPASTFSTQGEYIILLTSWNKIVINKPIAVYVGENPPTCSGTTPTPTPTLSCSQRLTGFTVEDFTIWKNEFKNPQSLLTADYNCSGKTNLSDFEILRNALPR